MKSSRNIAVSIVVVIAIARVMFGLMARLSNVKPHLKLLRFKESGAYLGPGTRERSRTHVPDCTGTDACISNDKSPAFTNRRSERITALTEISDRLNAITLSFRE